MKTTGTGIAGNEPWLSCAAVTRGRVDDRLDQRLRLAGSLHDDMTTDHLEGAPWCGPRSVSSWQMDSAAYPARSGSAAAGDARWAALIDIRSDTQIARDGVVAGALAIPPNVLEWRLDRAGQLRHPWAPQPDDQVILLCDEGYRSSLAATLQQLGFACATDAKGGFQAGRAAGLPVEQPSPPGKRHRRHRAVVQRAVLRVQPTALPRLNRGEQ